MPRGLPTDHDTRRVPRWPVVAGACGLFLAVLVGAYAAGVWASEGDRSEPQPAITSGIMAAPQGASTGAGDQVPDPPEDEQPDEQIHPAGIDPGRHYVLENVNGGRVMDVANVSADNGAPVHLWDRHDGENQQWRFVPVDDGYYELVVRHSGKLLEVPAGVPGVPREPAPDGPLTVATQLTRTAQVNQHWAVLEAGAGAIRLVNRANTQVLEAREGGRDNGTLLVPGIDGAQPHQMWRLVPVE